MNRPLLACAASLFALALTGCPVAAGSGATGGAEGLSPQPPAQPPIQTCYEGSEEAPAHLAAPVELPPRPERVERPLRGDGEVVMCMPVGDLAAFEPPQPDRGPACSACRGAGVPIVYGRPGPETLRQHEAREVLHVGDCAPAANAPRWHCWSCPRSW